MLPCYGLPTPQGLTNRVAQSFKHTTHKFPLLFYTAVVHSLQSSFTLFSLFSLFSFLFIRSNRFVLVLHLSFVISNYVETFGGCHLPPVAYSTSSTRCPLHRCLASTNIHEVTTQYLEIQIPIARSPRSFAYPIPSYNID